MAGTKNSGRPVDRPFGAALRMELAAAGENHKALRKIARALIASAEEGKLDAIKELADRIDGKVPQAVMGTGDEGVIEHIHRIERVIVNASRTPD